MPRSLVKGRQIRDFSITDKQLAVDSVVTEKIMNGNVTCEKLAPGLCDRFLSSNQPIGRIKLTDKILANIDFQLPSGLTYDITTFVERVAVYRNGQMLFNGILPPSGDEDPVEVYPGSDNTKIRFDFDIRKGEIIQVIIL